MSDPKVGGEVESFCTTCKIMKDHVVVAMMAGRPAKVECLGCGKQHGYRPTLPGEKPARAPRAASPRAKIAAAPPAPALDLEARLSGGVPRGYAPADRYALDDLVRHPTFGTGVVTGLPAAQKVEITFRAGKKLLLHDRAGTVASTLERPAPRDESRGPLVSDAPPK